MIITILEMRSYAKAKEIYDSTPMDKRPKSKMIDRVGEIKAAIAKEKIRQAQENEGE